MLPVLPYALLYRYGPPTRTDYRIIVENLSSRCSWQVSYIADIAGLCCCDSLIIATGFLIGLLLHYNIMICFITGS